MVRKNSLNSRVSVGKKARNCGCRGTNALVQSLYRSVMMPLIAELLGLPDVDAESYEEREKGLVIEIEVNTDPTQIQPVVLVAES